MTANTNPRPAIPNNAIEAMDPCGDRMQDLCGALLSYYLVKHQGPSKLEDLQQFADIGDNLKFTCPVSGKPYVYVAEGLEATGQDIRIYIYDPTPIHHGNRWWRGYEIIHHPRCGRSSLCRATARK